MDLFSSFSRKAPTSVFVAIVLGGLAGVCYSFLIPLVLGSLADPGSRYDTVDALPWTVFNYDVANWRFAVAFTCVCVAILVARTVSQLMLTRVSMDVAHDLRVQLYRRIAGAPIAEIERIGPSRLIAALSDVPRIVSGARMLPDLLISLVTLVGMLGFLLYLNADVFWFVIGCIAFGAATYQLPMLVGRRYFMRSRRSLDALQESIRGLIQGVKELKLGAAKREAYFREVLLANEIAVVGAEKRGQMVVRAAMNYGDLLSFFVIGAVSFVFINYHVISKQELIGVIMALLYVTGPVGVVLNFIPQIAVARVSMRAIGRLLDEIAQEDVADGADAAPVAPWRTLRFEGVGYAHRAAADGHAFSVGPIDLELHKGEIAFIVGGNGSGKSTLSKLLTLHYLPASGTIAFGDTRADATTIARLREQVTAIYSDYYLFDRILGAKREGLDDVVAHYLRVLQLDRKVTYRDGRFSTLALSDGQRRRLALLSAFVEEKEMYLFDEWAADQDPLFKDVFYHDILPSLRARGKLVVAITHDDRYFHVADRIVVMEEGAVVRIETPARSEREAAPRETRQGPVFALAG